MPVFLYKPGLAYYPLPCCASSSLKVALFRLVTGITLDHNLAHEVWPSGPYFEPPLGSFAFAIVRDPVERFVVAYRRWVREGQAFGLPAPSIEQCVFNIDQYRRESWLFDHHVRPISWFLGSSLEHINLFRLDEMDRLVVEIETRTGCKMTIDQLNSGDSVPISTDAGAFLRDYYAECYEMLKGLNLKRRKPAATTTMAN